MKVDIYVFIRYIRFLITYVFIRYCRYYSPSSQCFRTSMVYQICLL